MSIQHKADAVIIGAGVIGCAIAFEMSKKGYQTINVDQLSGPGAGSTVNSCAIIRYSYSTLTGVAMAHECKFYWENWKDYTLGADEGGAAVFHQLGGLYMNYDSPVTQRILSHYDEVGVRYEIWSPEELTRRVPVYDISRFWPPMRPSDEAFWEKPKKNVSGAVFNPDAGFINDPQLSTRNLMRAAEAKGARFLFNKNVTGILTQHERAGGVVFGNGDMVLAPIVINAAGPHSFIINKMAGVEKTMNIKTRPLRHEVHHVPAPPGIDFWKQGYYTGDGDNGIYFRPETGNQILVGSEDPECDARDWVEDPDHYSTDLTEDQYKAQVLRLARRIPSLEVPNKPKGIVDLYDVSDDWMPLYDKSDLPGFYMAVGTSGNQYKTAPVVGKLMTKLITDCENGQDHDIDPITFTLPYTNRLIDTRFFSRKREINKESSFSVAG